MDPYVYDNSTILINKLNIKDEQQLIDIDTINGANEYFYKPGFIPASFYSSDEVTLLS